MTGAGPPKCKTCGVAEWRHLCSGGAVTIAGVRLDGVGDDEVQVGRNIKAVAAPAKKSVLAKTALAAVLQPVRLEAPPTAKLVGDKPAPPGHGTDRKEYLKLKARERRARQKGEAK